MILLYVLYALVGLSIIVFIHESGHFLAAKKVGVRVERFSIGFDPPFKGRNLRFFSFRRGETEYVLGMVPFGGYVKLAGEVLCDSEKKPAPHELLAKSVGARALVFVAGSVMNILSAFFFFIVAFSLGVSFVEPRVGMARPGYPAWQAGIKPEDTVLAINGKEVTDFSDMTLAVALGRRSQPMVLRISRLSGETRETLEVPMTPRWNVQHGINEVGIEPATSNVLVKPPPASPAARVGLEEDDIVVGLEVRGERLPPLPPSILMNAIPNFNLLYPAEPLRLLILRKGKEEWVRIVPQKKEGGEEGRLIGVLSGQGNVVRGIQVDSQASEFLKPRDEILEIGGNPTKSIEWQTIIEKWPGAEKLELKAASPDGSIRAVSVDREAFLTWNMRGEIQWDTQSARIGALKAGAVLAAAGFKPGDVLTELNDVPCYDPDQIPEILSSDPKARLSVRYLREGKPSLITVDRSALEDLSGVTWQTMPPIGGVSEGGPAQKAGIVPGSTILRLGETELFAWEDMMAQIAKLKPGSMTEVTWRTPGGETRKGSLTVGLEPMEPLGIASTLLQRKVRAGVLHSFVLGAKRTVVFSQQIFLTLKSLIRRDVSAKNLQGPVGITHALTILAQGPFTTLLYVLGLISINLGLLNLLPFPILDGGHLLFLAIEKIKGSPVDVRVQEWAMNIAFILILSLAVFVTYNDILRLFN